MSTQHLEIPVSDFQRVRRITFSVGDAGTSGEELVIGDVITEDGVGTGEGYVCRVETDTGTWEGGDAAGTIWYVKKNDDAEEFAALDTCSVTGKTGLSFTIDAVDNNAAGVLNLRTNSCVMIALQTYTPNTGYSSPVSLLWYQMMVEFDETALETYGITLNTGDHMQFPVNCSHGRHALDAKHGSFALFARWDESAEVLGIFLCFQGLIGQGDGDLSIPDAVMSISPADDAGDLLPLSLSDIDVIHLAFETTEDLDGGVGGSAVTNLAATAWGLGRVS